MLQLLLEGGQGYADIGSLLGISPEEVRSRARAALGEIGGADPDAQVPISDYLLGQADPIGRADAVRHLQSDPEANALAERLVAQLRLLAPKAQLPEIPAARGGRRAATPPPPVPPAAPQAPTATPGPPPAAPSPGPGGPSIRERLGGALGGGGPSRRQSQIAVGVGAGALLIIVVVLAVSGVFGGSDDGDGGGGEMRRRRRPPAQKAGTRRSSAAGDGPGSESRCPPQVRSGSRCAASKGGAEPESPVRSPDQPQRPAADGEGRDIVWLYNSDTVAFPLARRPGQSEGEPDRRRPRAGQHLLLLQEFQAIRLSRVDAAQAQQIQQSLQNQGQQPVGVVPFLGEPALEGPISELG